MKSKLNLLMVWQVLAFVVGITTGSGAKGVAGESENVQARGREVRDVILRLLERAEQNEGRWPEGIEGVVAGGRESGELVYRKPGPVIEHGATVVVRERMENYPQGVWVGFGDGHLEFVKTREEVAWCEDGLDIMRQAVARYGNVFGQKPTPEVKPADVKEKLEGELTVRVVDSEGREVAGAKAGVFGQFGDNWGEDERVIFFDKPKNHPILTDGRGEIRLRAARVFNPVGLGSRFLDVGTAPLYVLEEKRGLVAMEELKLDDFGKGKVREVKLWPVCHVKGSAGCMGLAEVGKKMGLLECFAFKPGLGDIRSAFFVSEKGHSFDLPVAPGDYGIYVHAVGCESTIRYVHVEPGRREISFETDLMPRTDVSGMIGQVAPELRGIKGWRKGGSVKLAEQRGRVVMLDFWGYWCGPCVGSMPEVMRLHDKYKDRGLVVVGVHDDSLAGVAELEEKIAERRDKYWGGRDMPFAVALDGGGEVRIPGSGRFTRGTTTAAYHVSAFPTTVLIGRDGKIAGEIRLYDPPMREAAEKRIRELLDAK